MTAFKPLFRGEPVAQDRVDPTTKEPLVFAQIRAEFALPDTEMAEEAYRFAEEIEPGWLFSHSVRCYLYASALGGHVGLQDYDNELVFLSCVLHDVGLTDQGNRDHRFEVDGADLAAEFLRERGMNEKRVRTVWEAIALHTTDSIPSRMGPEVALTQVGIGADLFGLFREELPADLVTRAHSSFPRADLGYAIAEAIVEQAAAKPQEAGLTSPAAQLVRWHRPLSTLPHWNDLVAESGWGDQPPAAQAEGAATSPEGLAQLFVDFLAASDLDGLVSLYEPTATFQPEPGQLVSGTAAIRESLRKYVKAGARISLDTRKLHVVGDLALMSSRAKVEGLLPDGELLATTTTEVVRRQPDGRWLYVVDDPFFENN
jgi:ketosteroid isomerase-like protein